MINRGGEKIAPREIDEVLLAHPAVAEAVAFRRAACHVGRRGRGGRCRARTVSEAELLAYCQRAPGGLQAPEADSHHRDACRAPRPARFSAAPSRRRSDTKPKRREVRDRRRRRDRRVHRRDAGQGRGRRRAVRARSTSARHAGARAAGDQPGRRFRSQAAVTGDLATIGRADVVVLGVKAHSLTSLAPQLRPLLGPDTAVVSTQNGIPWWYFQTHGGELDGLRLERVDPGGVIASSIEARRVVGSLAYFATDIVEPGVIRHTEGNKISFGEPDGTKSERLPRDRRAADRCRVPLPDNAALPPRDLGQAARQRRVQPDQRTDRRDARADRPPSRRVAVDPRDHDGNRSRRRRARHRAADFDRPANGRRGEGRRAQDLDAAGPRGRPAARTRGGGGRGRRARAAARVQMPVTQTVYACAKMLGEKQSREKA